MIAHADWVVDLGPEGGDGGGSIVAQGTPEQVATRARGATPGNAIKQALKSPQPASAPAPSPGE